MDVSVSLRRAAYAAVLACSVALPTTAVGQPSSNAPFNDVRTVQAFDQQVTSSTPTHLATTPRHYRQGRIRIDRVPGLPPGHRVRFVAWNNGTPCASEAAAVTAWARLGLRVTAFPNTYEDIVVDCPGAAIPAFPGVLNHLTTLASCLPLGFATLDAPLNNIEVLSASIVDTSLLPFMVPGIRDIGLCPSTPTDVPEGDLVAKQGRFFLVQAMDPCVGGTGTPPSCAVVHNVTDGTPFAQGKLIYRSNGLVKYSLRSSSIGSPLAGLAVRLDLTVRMTDPATLAFPLTQADVALSCPPVVIAANGNVNGFHNLYTDCGLPNLPAENIEIVSLAIVNVGNGRPIAVPGVRGP